MLGARGPAAARRARRADVGFLSQLGRAERGARALPRLAGVVSDGAHGAREPARRLLQRGVRAERRACRSTPAAWGCSPGDHLKSASDLGVPLVGRGPPLPGRVLPPVPQRGRVADGDVPAERLLQHAASASFVRRGRRAAGHGVGGVSRAGWCTPRSGASTSVAMPLYLLDTNVEDNSETRSWDHAGAVQRRGGASHSAADDPRDRRLPRAGEARAGARPSAT
jgi:hypothetical protein